MFINLRGFECQVMLDVHQVSDTLDKKWSTLNSVLAGKGCANLEVEWEEIRYKELYAALAAFVNEDFYKKGLAILKKPAAAGIKKFLDSSKKAALAFYQKADLFRTQDHKIFGETFKPLSAAAAKKSAQDQFKAFEKSFKKACKIAAAKKGAKDLSKAKNAADFVLYGESLNWTNPEILLSECVALSLAERAFAARWSLDRKLCEAMQAAGVEWKGQRDVLYRAFVLAKISGLDLAASKAKKAGKAASNPALALASLCCESADAVALSRANSFDNVVWFNKEELDRSLFLAAQNEFILGINSDKDILAFYKLMAAAQEKAEYKCRALVEQFEPQKPKGKKAASKKAAASGAAKKATASGAKKAATKKVKAATKSAENKVIKKVAKTATKKAAATTKQSKAKPAAKTARALEKNKKALKKAGGREMAETTAKKATAKKAAATKKPAAKKPAAKKAPAKKTAAKKTTVAKKPAAKKAPAKKATAAKKPAAKKATAAKKPAAKKATTAKKPAAKKATAAKKPAAKKTTTK